MGCVPPHRLVLCTHHPALVGGVCRLPPKPAHARGQRHGRRRGGFHPIPSRECDSTANNCDQWLFRRLLTTRRSVVTVGDTTPEGIPYLAPEILLLCKDKVLRQKDEADFLPTDLARIRLGTAHLAETRRCSRHIPGIRGWIT
jgi:hypothetical protein